MPRHTVDISNSADVIDIRNIIERFEELEQEKADDPDVFSEDDATELADLTALLEECRGNGGDEQWRGDWYPVTLIRESYFEDYARELADDIGAINADATWPNNCIDWKRAARELLQDYTSIDYGHVTYYTR